MATSARQRYTLFLVPKEGTPLQQSAQSYIDSVDPPTCANRWPAHNTLTYSFEWDPIYLNELVSCVKNSFPENFLKAAPCARLRAPRKNRVMIDLDQACQDACTVQVEAFHKACTQARDAGRVSADVEIPKVYRTSYHVSLAYLDDDEDRTLGPRIDELRARSQVVAEALKLPCEWEVVLYKVMSASRETSTKHDYVPVVSVPAYSL
eukprot:TRINITY_DN907_c1_g3_i1.p1 TRINITY_DN907_c1_g3~~TRINITY_DN907_c1_g3_i1.p1  ORF type:complete len:207 (+),score=17.13 TRINITY_DN907_c1_g3_i1:408-1028(+)